MRGFSKAEERVGAGRGWRVTDGRQGKGSEAIGFGSLLNWPRRLHEMSANLSINFRCKYSNIRWMPNANEYEYNGGKRVSVRVSMCVCVCLPMNMYCMNMNINMNTNFFGHAKRALVSIALPLPLPLPLPSATLIVYRVIAHLARIPPEWFGNGTSRGSRSENPIGHKRRWKVK